MSTGSLETEILHLFLSFFFLTPFLSKQEMVQTTHAFLSCSNNYAECYSVIQHPSWPSCFLFFLILLAGRCILLLILSWRLFWMKPYNDLCSFLTNVSLRDSCWNSTKFTHSSSIHKMNIQLALTFSIFFVEREGKEHSFDT